MADGGVDDQLAIEYCLSGADPDPSVYDARGRRAPKMARGSDDVCGAAVHHCGRQRGFDVLCGRDLSGVIEDRVGVETPARPLRPPEVGFLPAGEVKVSPRIRILKNAWLGKISG